VAPHLVDSKFFLEIDTYRGIVAEAMFQCIGRPVFFDELVLMLADSIRIRNVSSV
jgi:hypothetical protein